MNNPFAPLPETVCIDGQEVPIQTDFRAGVQLEQAWVSGNIEIEALLRMFYPQGIPQNGDAAVQAMLDFWSGWKPKEETESSSGQGGKRAYDFVQDADALTASFLQAYGIDLTTAPLHWWTFRRLLFGLPAECPFMQRVYYRTGDTSGMSREQKKHFEKMRVQYALHGAAGKTLAERDQAMKAQVQKRFQEMEKTQQTPP